MCKKRKTLIWLILFSIMSFSCGNINNATPSPDVPPCTPESNAYVTPIHQNLIDLYERGINSQGNSDDFTKVQRDAFDELVNHVYYLSDSVEIPSGEKTVRITVTYISPELAHIIVVNHYLHRRFFGFSGRLNEQVQTHLSRIIGRNEYVFFITFTASVYTDKPKSTVNFPMGELELINTDNKTVTPAHSDHQLQNSFALTNGPRYGFFYYPMAINQNGTCQTVLDPNFDTRIMLRAPTVSINEVDKGSFEWSYEVAPLIDVTDVSGAHQNRFTMPLLADQFSPRTSTLTATDRESLDFWAALSRIIWLEITQDQ